MNTRIALIGYGKMGKTLENLVGKRDEVVIGCIADESNNKNGNALRSDEFKSCDVAIDFSSPKVVVQNITACLDAKIPVVVGTTGWNDKISDIEKLVIEKSGHVIYGSNFSLGVQLFIKLIGRASELFGNSTMFDASLHETHHTQKVDVPSGTALTLANKWLDKSSTKKNKKIGVDNVLPVDKENFIITSQRIGSVLGEHRLTINSDFDDIIVSHRARSRDGFASGAIQTALWIQNVSPGFYLLEDVVEQVLKV